MAKHTTHTVTREPHTMSFPSETWKKLRLLTIYHKGKNNSHMLTFLINREFDKIKDKIAQLHHV